MERLQREAVSLREQIQEEQRRRSSRVLDLQEQLRGIEGQNRQLQAQLSQAQLQNTSKVSDATALKREVVAKTMELEKLAREFQQSQSDLFSRVHSVSDSLLQMSRDLRVREVGEVQRLSSIPSAIPFPSQNGRHEAGNGEGASPQFASLRVDDETFEALKRRLQSLGDVVVFTSDKFDACCASGHSIPPGAVRVRPRRCDHVFLVECLMPYWVEGLCPVCRCSFAYNRDANDESDRCSSVSTSVSQRATLISHSRQAEALSKGEVREATSFREPSLGNLGFTRGPKVLQREIQTRPADRSERYKGITSSRVPSDASGFDRDRDATRVVRSPSRSGTGATGAKRADFSLEQTEIKPSV
eukprot:symbB.v1.2.002148.t1/scaffold116.1/size325063/5